MPHCAGQRGRLPAAGLLPTPEDAGGVLRVVFSVSGFGDSTSGFMGARLHTRFDALTVPSLHRNLSPRHRATPPFLPLHG